MASRPQFKHGTSFGHPEEAYQMQPQGEKAALATATGAASGTTSNEEDQGQCKGATVNDWHDMRRLGKVQELRVS